MEIGWSNTMQPPQNFTEIPPALVAVSLDGQASGDKTGLRARRRLSTESQDLVNKEALFKSLDGTFEQKMKILQALEIKIMPLNGDDEDEIENIGFTYDLIDFKQEALWLQFTFDDPNAVSKSLTEQH